MQKYVYTLCFLTGTPLLAGSGIISPSELENLQKQGNKSEDTLILQDGTSIKGTLKSIPQLEYSFGSLPINVKDVAFIAFSPKSEKNKIQIITHGGYSYVADLPTENFILIQYLPSREHPQYTIQKEISPSNIKYVTLKQTDGKYSNPKKRMFDIELKNGDHLPGSILTDTITLSTGLRDGKIKTENLVNLEVDFGIHGYTTNKQGMETEFDYTYAKDKFLNLQIAQTQQSLGLPWTLINKIQRVEPRSAAKLEEQETTMAEAPIPAVMEAQEEEAAMADKDMLFQQIETSVVRHEETKDRIQALQDEIQIHIAARESLQAELQAITDAKAELEEMRTKYQQANQSIQSLQEEIKNQVAVREKLQAQLQDASKAKEEINDLRSKYNQANQSIQSLQQEIQNQVAVRENFQSDLQDTSTANAEMDELRAKYEETSQSLHALQDEIKDLVAVRQNLQEELDAASKAKVQLDELRGKYDEANQSIQALQEKINNHVADRENMQSELQDASIAKAEMDDLRSKYEKANQSVQSLQNQIEKHITARENLQTELRGVAEVRAEMEELLMQKSEAEGQIRLTYNLETEFVKTKILKDQLDQLSSDIRITDKGTLELVNRYEAEVKALQLLLSGKQRKVEFSEKELAQTLKEIGKWKESAQKQNMQAQRGAPLQNIHPVHILSDVDILSTALNAQSKKMSSLKNALEETKGRINTAEERSNSLNKIANTLQQTLEETQQRYNTAEQKSQSLEAEFLRQVATTENLENKYLTHKTELENTITSLREAHEEVQNQLQQKETVINDLKATQDELQNTIANFRQAQEEGQKQLQDKENVIYALSASKEDLEKTITNFQEAQEQGQKELQEKETIINALTAVKEELEMSLAQLKEAEENQIRVLTTQDNHEHQMHLLSDIDQLTKALKLEQNSVHATKQNLQELETTITSLQEALTGTQMDLSEKEREFQMLQAAKAEVEENHSSQIESYASIIAAKHKKIEELEMELENALRAELIKRFEYEERLADMTQNLAEEKRALEQTQQELEQALDRINNTSQFAESLENQLQSITQKAISFGDEYAMTKEKLSEAETELQDLHASNLHLQYLLAESANKMNDGSQQIRDQEEYAIKMTQKAKDQEEYLSRMTEKAKDQEEYVTKMTEKAKDLEDKLVEKSLELDNLRSSYLSEQYNWVENHAIKHGEYAQKIEELQSALENERNKGQREIEELMAAIGSERELTRELGVQLQRVHATETKFKKQLEQQATKISEAASIIGSLKTENHNYKEKLEARYEGIDILSHEIADLQENTNVVKAFQVELEKIKTEKEQLLQKLQEERDAVADKTALIKGLDAIVKLQKSTLERIERSQMVLKEDK